MRQFLGNWKRTLVIGLSAGGAAIATLEAEKRFDFAKQRPWILPAVALLAGSFFHKKMPNVADGLVGYGGFYLTLYLYSQFVSKTPTQLTIGQTAGDVAADEINAGTGALDYTQAGMLMGGAGDMAGALLEESTGWGDAGAMMGAGYIDNAAALSDAFGLEG